MAQRDEVPSGSDSDLTANVPPPPVRIVLARHGESAWNAAGILQGHDGPGLNERGAAQAAALARALATRFPDTALIMSSDLDRARQTAERISASLPHAHLSLDSRLRESDIGTWSGRTLADIAREEPSVLRAWLLGEDVQRGGGETKVEMLTRVALALSDGATEVRRLARISGEKARTLIAITHGGPIRLAVASVLGLFPDKYRPLEPPSHTSITIVNVYGIEGTSIVGRLDAYNETAHVTSLLGSPMASGELAAAT